MFALETSFMDDPAAPALERNPGSDSDQLSTRWMTVEAAGVIRRAGLWSETPTTGYPRPRLVAPTRVCTQTLRADMQTSPWLQNFLGPLRKVSYTNPFRADLPENFRGDFLSGEVAAVGIPTEVQTR
jgi:hypothetical protein